MKRRALSWFMAAALGVGTMAGGIGSANIVLAEEQKEETEAADETSEEPADETDSDSSVMKIGALKGPTAMGMAQLLDDENYEFSLAASPDEIVPMIVQVKGHTKVLILHKCSGYKRLWKKSNCCLVFCKRCYNLCMLRLVLNGHILLRIQSIRLQNRV